MCRGHWDIFSGATPVRVEYKQKRLLYKATEYKPSQELSGQGAIWLRYSGTD